MEINIDDINVSYIKAGKNGSNVLLLHGWGSKKELFNNMIDKLSKSHIVYAIDLPGFGNTKEPSYAMSVSDYTDFVIKFIEKLGLNEVSILGHSFGGRIIIKMANRNNLSFKLNKLVLLDSAGIKPKNNGSKTFKSQFYKAVKKVVSTKLVKKAFPNALDNLKNKFGSEDYKNASKMMKDILVKTVNEDLEGLLENINNKTLILWGENDDATPLSDAKIMNEKIKNSELVVIKGGSHYSFLDNPVYANKIVDKFLLDEEK